MAEERPAKVFTADFPHQLSSYVLSQFAGVSSDPYTGWVSTLIGRQFKISLKGARNVNNAFNNLPCFQTSDKDLTFGWGPKAFLRSRVIHDNNYEHLLTMITLSESFHENYAARVMYELALFQVGTDDITPHYDQWRRSVHCLNGAFSSSDFGILVEDYIRLSPYNLKADLDEAYDRFPIDATLVARGLRALAKVTTGETVQLTIVGSGVIAWLGALANWVYDLRISFYAYDGMLLHNTHPQSAGPTQILFIFGERPGIDCYPGAWNMTDAQHVTDITASDAATSLRKLSLNTYSYPKSMHVTPFSGRTAWQSVLPIVFGKAYHELDHSCASILGTFVGGMARVFQGLATGEEVEGDALLNSMQKANTASYGPGLVQTLGDWMPELRRMQGRMERQLKLTSDEAKTSVIANVNRLREHCSCGICSSKRSEEEADPFRPTDTTKPYIYADTSTEDPERPSDWASLAAPPFNYCLTALAETIIVLGITLSSLAVSSQLFPSRAGIQSLYYSQVLNRLAGRGLPWQEHFKLVYGREWAAPDSRRLGTAVMLFTGSRPQRGMVDGLVGVSHEGICASFMDVERARRSVQNGARLIRMTSGGINVKWKVFSRVASKNPTEGRVGGLLDEDGIWERIEVEHLEEPLYFR